MNCSGKHAAMLATCRVNGWDTKSYRSPDHPLQDATRETFAELVGEPVETVAVDGCGAPLFPASLVGLARAFRRLALGLDGSDQPDPTAAQVAEAIRAHPEYVSGTRRDERTLLTAIPGAIGKAGAESCYAVALADGRAVALKTDDGAPRARGGQRRGASYRTGAAARRRRARGRDPGVLLGRCGTHHAS
jgi:L-asparaginase II